MLLQGSTQPPHTCCHALPAPLRSLPHANPLHTQASVGAYIGAVSKQVFVCDPCVQNSPADCCCVCCACLHHMLQDSRNASINPFKLAANRDSMEIIKCVC